MQRRTAAALALTAIVLVGACSSPETGPEPPPAGQQPSPERTAAAGTAVEPRELPPLRHEEFRSRPLGRGGRYLFHPRSAPIEAGVPYSFEVPHCGLTWLVDFDASFWDPLDPNGAARDPDFFINSKLGTVTITSENRAQFATRSGVEVTLRRHRGPKAAYPCR